MVNLILESPAEPVYKPVAGDVAGCGDLELPKIRSHGGVIDSHAIVTKSKNKSEEKTTHELASEEKGHTSKNGHLCTKCYHPAVMQQKANLLKYRICDLLFDSLFSLPASTFGSFCGAIGVQP
mmetsp:Transcript_33990/g.59118  ORF Transcript_33990/g.59118 Transcript_33990/m.59118 type:complete len:123 (+) Transcript_33990:267-635(+)